MFHIYVPHLLYPFSVQRHFGCALFLLRLLLFLLYEVLRIVAVGTSLVVQWLRLHASNAGGMVFDPWLGNLDPTCCTVWPKKKKKISNCHIFYKYDFQFNLIFGIICLQVTFNFSVILCINFFLQQFLLCFGVWRFSFYLRPKFSCWKFSALASKQGSIFWVQM